MPLFTPPTNVIVGGNSGSAYTLALSTPETILQLTLTANCTLSITGLKAGYSVTMEITQDATGSRSLTLPTSLKPGGNIALSGTAAAVDIITMYSPDGSSLRAFVAGIGLA